MRFVSIWRLEPLCELTCLNQPRTANSVVLNIREAVQRIRGSRKI